MDFHHAALAGQIISDAVNKAVGNNTLSPALATGTGAEMIVSLAIGLMTAIRVLIIAIALFTFTRAGLRLINSTDDDKLNKAKQTMASSVIGIMLAFVVLPLVESFYGLDPATVGTEGGTVIENPNSVEAGSSVFKEEILGAVNWITALVPPIAVLVIVISALQCIAAFGKEEAVGKLRQSIIGVVTGLLILMSTDAIMAAFGLSIGWPPGVPSVAPLYVRAFFIINSLLVYLGWGATIMAIYAGLLMILNLGNDDQYGKAKALLFRIAIGIGIIFISFVAVRFVMFLVLGQNVA